MAAVSKDSKFIDIFRTFFVGFNLARLRMLVVLIQAMSSARSGNFVKVAAGMNS